jgi:hypothetical protein
LLYANGLIGTPDCAPKKVAPPAEHRAFGRRSAA